MLHFKTGAIGGALAIAASFMAVETASAATLTASNFASTDPINAEATVTINDNTAGVLTFEISLANANGLLSGVWLDFSAGGPFVAGDVTSLDGSISIIGFTLNDNGLTGFPGSNAINLNGSFTVPAGNPINGASGDFDFGFGFNGGTVVGDPQQVAVPYSFTVDDQSGALTLASFERIGLRFQSVGSVGSDGLGGNSQKLISYGPYDIGGGTPPPNPIPLPAAAWLLLSGIGGLGVMGWRKRRADA